MLLIQNGLLYTMEADEPIFADILIKNGKISEISKNIEATSEMKIIDAKNMCVFPGLLMLTVI